MRDPELVFKAQQAAAALERAWQRWRVVHGLIADPMPAISSYVGYSLEEPWGQPRVVFGLSADDADQLAALLDRHDCVGPVRAMIAAEQGGFESAAEAGGPASRPLPVPPQAPSPVAGQSVPVGRPGRLGRAARFIPTAGKGEDWDEPLFRQVAAAQQAAAARDAVAAPGPDEADEVAVASEATVVSKVTEVDVAHVAAGSASDESAGGQGSAAEGAPGESAAGQSASDETATAQSTSDESATAQSASGETATAEGGSDETATAHGARDRGAADRGAGDRDADEAAWETGSFEPDRSGPAHPAADVAAGPGPLALAASAARVEAEARIRAALHQTRAVVPAASWVRDAAGTAEPGRSAADSGDAEHPRAEWVAAQAPAPRPEVASGAQPWLAEEPSEAAAADWDRPYDAAADWDRPYDAASSRSDPEFDADDSVSTEAGAFSPGPDQADDEEGDPEAGTRADEPQDRGPSGYPRRSRMTRSYSVARLSRSKRPGAVPGAQQPG